MSYQIEKINKLIDNDIDFEFDKNFVTIIGSSPSKGARSPILWNRAYNNNSKDISMFPIDCSGNNLDQVLDLLFSNKFFLGSAVTTPFKEQVCNHKYLKLTNETKMIGAANCIFKKNKYFFATNTDGEAAINSLKSKYSIEGDKRIMVLGTGGTAKAVIAFLLNSIPKNNILNFGRTKENLEIIYSKFGCLTYDWSSINDHFNEIDIIINCTSVGWGEYTGSTPIAEEELSKLKKNTYIFDVIYDPPQTKLIKLCNKLGLKTLNGLEMNLDQAAIAYCYVNNLDQKLVPKIKKDMFK
tara:strand:- start:27547 stop:28437 length:891 start_codon:yes stop_codon:yes gene_type:complete